MKDNFSLAISGYSQNSIAISPKTKNESIDHYLKFLKTFNDNPYTNGNTI